MRPLALGLAGLLLAACGAGPEHSGAAPARAGDEPLRLLDPGDEPRRALRAPPRGEGLESRRLELLVRGTQREGGAFGEVLAPPVGLDLQVRRSEAADGLLLEATTGPFELMPDELTPPATLLAMQAALEGSAGLRLEARLSDPSHALEGIAVVHEDAEVPQVQQLAAALAQVLALARVLFPTEPVGVGARWAWTSSHRNTLGAIFEMETTARLLEADGPGSLRLRLDSRLRGPRQRLTGPPLPPGSSLDVTSHFGEGWATLVFEAEQLLPTELHAEGRWELVLILDQADRSTQHEMVQDLRVTMP